LTKKQRIIAFLKEDKGYLEIAGLVDSSYKYVANIAMDLKNPRSLAKAARRYWNSKKGKKKRKEGIKARRKWARKNSHKTRIYRRKNRSLHYNQTRPLARNHRKRWTSSDIKYLKRYGKKKSVHELALELGRSHDAVQTRAVRKEIDLRGDKVGAGSARFRGLYKKS
jgi:hypothetical protein